MMLFLAPFFSQAQNLVTDFKDLGDKAFANKEYYAASVYYQKVVDSQQEKNEDKPYQAHTKTKKAKFSNAYVYYQLAESYRLYRNFVNAQPFYYKVLQEPEAAQYPFALFWYGVCLRTTQQFDEAIKQLELFLASGHTDKSNDNRARREIINCNFAKKQYEFPGSSTVTRMTGDWNADGSSYSLSKNENGTYWFTSSRFAGADRPKKNKLHFNRLFYVDKNSMDSTGLQPIKFTESLFDNDGEWGTPALNPSGKRLYFTYWFKQGKETLHAIFRSDYVGYKLWSTPKKLNINVNVDGFNAIQPFVTADGKYLYFVSNKPGTLGGYDLWMSELDSQGNPLPSINLGNTINTQQDEQAPYYDIRQKKLIYSSKGFIGLGGFDFMQSFGEVGKWAKPENMGYPMNSPKDDLYYSIDPEDANLAYISSDRQSECCLELFTVKNSMPRTPEVKKIKYEISGLVQDCDQLKPLDSVKITLTDLQSKQRIKQLTTSTSGRYKVEVENKADYQLTIEKNGYFTKMITVSAAMENATDTLTHTKTCLQAFNVGKAIVLKNILFDYKKADLREQSKVELDKLISIMKDNPAIRIELSAHTDSVGSDNYNLKLSQARAQSCTEYLILMGISADRIFAKGYGKNRPVAPNTLPDGNDNPNGRQLNRRTEFMVL